MPYKPLDFKIVADSTMLWRLVAKLLFKATVPLIAVAGVFSYGVYMRGGDPSVMWQSLASGSVERVAGLFSGVQKDASRAVGTLSSAVADSDGAGKPERTQVFTWQDAQGITHYSTSAPASGVARTVTVDPNVNIVAPVRAPVVAQSARLGGDPDQSSKGAVDALSIHKAGSELDTNRRSSARQTQSKADAAAIAEVESELGGTLPGVAGQILSGQSAGGNGTGMDSSKLIRMLQSAGN